MWPKHYKDYPPDEPLIRYQVEAGRGIIGCEMHELNGWGENVHVYRKKRKGPLARLFLSIFGKVKGT